MKRFTDSRFSKHGTELHATSFLYGINCWLSVVVLLFSAITAECSSPPGDRWFPAGVEQLLTHLVVKLSLLHQCIVPVYDQSCNGLLNIT